MNGLIAGGTKAVQRGVLRTGGATRTLTRVLGRFGGSTRTLAAFVGPLTVTAGDAYGFSFSTSVTSSPVSTTPAGGLAPYTYSWVLLSGDAMTITAPTAANTRFSASVPANTTKTATARVTCTDALGSTATATITVTLESERFTGNQ